MSDVRVDLNNHIIGCEKVLNLGDFLPIVSSASGIVRSFLGCAEIVGGIATTIFLLVKAQAEENQTERTNKIKNAVDILTEYATHGVANFVRGFIAGCWPFSLFVLVPYDLSNCRVTYHNEDPKKTLFSYLPIPKVVTEQLTSLRERFEAFFASPA